MKDEMAIAGTPTLRKRFLKLIRDGNPNGSNNQADKRVQSGIVIKGCCSEYLLKRFFLLLLIIFFAVTSYAQVRQNPSRGYSNRIRNYIDTIKIVDSHEHFFDPELIKNSSLNDFMVLLHHYSFGDFISAGMDPKSWNMMVGDSLTTEQKWKILEPFWDVSFNTADNRVALIAADRLYGINDINSTTVGPLSVKIKNAYQSDWFRQVINEKCNIESLILDQDPFEVEGVKIYNVKRFTQWLTVRRKYTIDSISIRQVSQIKTLEDFVKSLETALKESAGSGIVAIKINIAYSRPLNFEDVKTEVARKVFRKIMDGEEGLKLNFTEVKPLQDYMLFRLLDLAKKYKLPVAFHTGLMAGSENNIKYADPTLLTNLFQKYPEINFVLFHGSYPYGGELATLVKNFRNVYIDLSWIYSISPSYSERYLKEWIETVPAIKIMAFGGDYATCENTFGELIIAKQVITRVLTEKVREGYFSEDEAMRVAKMILHDSAVRFYNLR